MHKAAKIIQITAHQKKSGSVDKNEREVFGGENIIVNALARVG
jgi:hypothetical protein